MQRLIFLITLIFCTTSSHGQNMFHVDFHVEDCGKNREVTFLFHNGEKFVPASVRKEGNHYLIEGTYYGKLCILEISEAIDSTSKIGRRFFLDEKPAKIEYISCDSTNDLYLWKDYKLENVKDFVPFYKKIGLFTKKEIGKVNEEQKKVDKEFRKLNELPKPIVMSDYDSLLKSKEKVEVAQKIFYNKQLEFIKLNADDYMSFVQFREIITQKQVLESDNVREVFSSFSSELRNSFEGKKLAQLIDEKRNRFENAPEIGKKAPNFKTTDIEGKDIELADFKGKYVLLVFWATWCSPCVKEISDIKAIRNKYKTSDLAIIYVSDDSDKNRFLNFIKKKQMNWHHIYGDKSIAKDYFVNGIPETVLINPVGEIIHINVGNEVTELKKMLFANIKKN
jgi:peroxiredoxin